MKWQNKPSRRGLLRKHCARFHPFHLARAAALIAFCVIWVRITRTWVDAFITMRVVDNFVKATGWSEIPK